ncbi:hypothetical protein QQZ08_004210 [Neonectria magnoliae]|uniref:Uncharacterized protein n=1 Tax=Neonectria magnoliae TaxID=2732573 RepID=A0ABR1I879_9HYPO
MPYLKLNLPLNGDADGGRQNFRVKIHSLEKWHQEVSASPQNRSANADKDFAIDGRRICIVDEDVTVDNLVTIILNATNVAISAAGHEHEEIAKQRWEALETLDGDRMPAPKRKLTGWHAPMSRNSKQQEAQEEIERLYIRRMLQSVVASPQYPHLRGWQFLQHVIASSLDAKTTGLFPPYFSLQRAVVVLIDKVRGREQARGVRCLDRCSDTERAEVLAQVEERGWRDVVWVTGFIDDIPSKMDTNRDPITLHWGQGG